MKNIFITIILSVFMSLHADPGLRGSSYTLEKTSVEEQIIINEQLKEQLLININDEVSKEYEFFYSDQKNCSILLTRRTETVFKQWQFNYKNISLDDIDGQLYLRCTEYDHCVEAYSERIVEERNTVKFSQKRLIEILPLNRSVTETLMESFTELAKACLPLETDTITHNEAKADLASKGLGHTRVH